MRCTNSIVAGALHMALNSKLRNRMSIIYIMFVWLKLISMIFCLFVCLFVC